MGIASGVREATPWRGPDEGPCRLWAIAGGQSRVLRRQRLLDRLRSVDSEASPTRRTWIKLWRGSDGGDRRLRRDMPKRYIGAAGDVVSVPPVASVVSDADSGGLSGLGPRRD